MGRAPGSPARAASAAWPLGEAHGIAVRWLGRLDFASGLAVQERALEAHARDGDVLLLLEHEPVYTTGRGGDAANLPGGDVEVHRISRGGDVTFHGPGQLVGYPVLELRRRGGDVHRYLRALEEGLVETCGALGLVAFRRPGWTGAWVGDGSSRSRKIASIGVGVRRGITQHGFALNVSVDLGAFAAIVPCGIEGVVMTSFEAEGMAPPPLVEDVARIAAAAVPQALAAAFATEGRRGRGPGGSGGER